MTLERHPGYNVIAFVCDECGEIEQTDSQDFFEAWEEIKQAGWTARKVAKDYSASKEWEHFCKDCS